MLEFQRFYDLVMVLPIFLLIRVCHIIRRRVEGTLLEGPIPSSFGALTKLEDL